MAEGYQKYDDEFKKIIVKQVKNGRKPAVLARLYGVSAPLIRYWVSKFGDKIDKTDNKPHNKEANILAK